MLPPARRFLDELRDEQAEEIRRLISLIEQDPWPDNRAKVVFYADPVTYYVYTHQEFIVLYTIEGNARIVIQSIRLAWQD